MLKGNKALVTGGSRGIGFAIAEALIKEGCRVVITGRKEETLKAAAEKLGEKASYMVWDVSDIHLAHEKVREAADIMGGLNILVNNAGILWQRSEWDKDSLLSTTTDDWRKVMSVNTDGLFFTMQAAVKYMRENSVAGNVLNITSVAGYEPAKGAYCTSKAAANALTRGWGQTFANDGITINGIAPGPVATEMNSWHEGDPLEHSRIPFGRFALCEEIAKLALYMLSAEAAMLCGETVVFDGAYHIR
jgi:3-oxoacyl-[acyl-carrier protein] reductase